MHRHLVGGVEHARRGAARHGRLTGQAQAREGLLVGSLELQRSHRREVERGHRDVGTHGMVQGVGDRHAHVGMPEVRERGAVVERDHAVDDRLRVDHHVDLLVGRAEQVVGLDHLEALVEQRGRVDGDAAAHLPGGVRERLLDGHVLELVGGAAAEWAAGSGEHELVDRARRLAGHQLVQRGVLGVDGDDLGAGGLGQRHHQLAPHHQALLVGQREIDPLSERGHGRPEARRTGKGVQHEIRPRLDDELDQALRCRPAPRRRSRPRRRGRRQLRRTALSGRRRARVSARAAARGSSPLRGRRPPARSCPGPPRWPGSRWTPWSPAMTTLAHPPETRQARRPA